MDIALVTCEAFPNLHEEDVLLRDALTDLGLTSGPVVWDAPHAPPRLAYLMRSAWDYHTKIDSFCHWLRGLAHTPPMFNDRQLMLWNTHKGYLLDLQAKGVPIVPTEVFARASQVSSEARPGRWIAKPAVGAGAQGACYGEWARVHAHLSALVTEKDMLLQPYVEAIESYGERSFLFVEGRYSHAVGRTLALLEGTGVEDVMPRVEPTPEELACAGKALEALPCVPLYARVDLLPGPLLLELEVIEPRLFMLECPSAARELARALASRFIDTAGRPGGGKE